MHLSIKTHLLYAASQPCDLLLQIETLSDAEQTTRGAQLVLSDDAVQHEITGEDGIGTRRWIKTGPMFACRYETQVDVTRPTVDIEALNETPRLQTPSDVIPFLMPSRYCHSDLFLDFVAGQFGGLTGGALISALNTWVNTNLTYDNAASFVGTTATDSFASLAGVCRDFAHVLISLARAGGIPARFVSAYAPDVRPQDFHAVVEVYLEGAWHILDPTGMAQTSEIARICVGRDAADASFMTSYGWMELREQSVEVTRLSA
ncbi:transglutaminase family protein [Shimia thalassica]|uniref:transglutaminase-like domain-containing protein n=1 Tax=Shimia thalassica TaxID=1715693 RepID=UPI001C08D2AA|nr:transglutaminase family protein [Shimia thalassica]MBU2944665.1 transglutaminase family protein [Shimia thalassica]